MLGNDAQAAYDDMIGLLDTTEADALTAMADRLQKLAKGHMDETRLCEFSQAQRMRRLLILPIKAWGKTEIRWAQDAARRIRELNGTSGIEADLALGCFGVWRNLEKRMAAMMKDRKAAERRKASSEEDDEDHALAEIQREVEKLAQ